MPIQPPVRWAILGAGKIAHKFAQDFASIPPNGQIVAVAARDVARARNFANQYGIAQAMDYEALYASPGVDAVYIATTHNFHKEQALRCLQSGKAVLCEKPITVNDAEFETLQQASAAHNVFLMEALWTYYLPAMQQAKRWLDEGRIGALKTVQADFGFCMPPDPQGRLYNASLAGGALLDIGVYALAFAYFFNRRLPDSLKAAGHLGPTGVDETTAIILTFGDITASLLVSIVTRLRNKATLFGENGFIELPDFWKASSALLYNGEYELQETFTDDRSTWGYNFEIAEATNCILRGETESALMPHRASLHLQQLMTEVRRQLNFTYPAERSA